MCLNSTRSSFLPAHVSTPLETRGISVHMPGTAPYSSRHLLPSGRSLRLLGNSAIRLLPTACRRLPSFLLLPTAFRLRCSPLPTVRSASSGYGLLTGRYPARRELLWTRRCHLPTSPRCTSPCSRAPLSSWNPRQRPLSASRQTPLNSPG